MDLWLMNVYILGLLLCLYVESMVARAETDSTRSRAVSVTEGRGAN